MQLANSCVDQLLACLVEESTSKLWRAKAASYASTRTDTTFLSYFASTTPESEHKRVRLKTVLFLQGSTLYDPKQIKGRLMERQKILKLEIAVVDGKVGFLLPFVSFCSLILRAYSSVTIAQPSRYLCTISEMPPLQKHTAL